MLRMVLFLSLFVTSHFAWAVMQPSPVVFEPLPTQGAIAARSPTTEATISAAGAVLAQHRGNVKYSMSFAGANRHAVIELADRLPGVSSYFIGPRSRWRTGVGQYAGAMVRGLYSGIDLKWHGESSRVEYDLIVQPGSNPDRIQIDFHGIRDLEIQRDGTLKIDTTSGFTIQPRPVLYQTAKSSKTQVQGRFRLAGQHSVRFDVSAYDRSLPLVIDPQIDFATLLGGSGTDAGAAVSFDAAGNVYVAGSTASPDFPGTSLLHSSPAPGQPDVFVTKLDPSGKIVLYSVFVGGSGADVATALAVDSAGNAYVTGTTKSTNFPTSQCIGSSQGSSAGGFLFKLNSQGTALSYSTCLAVNTTVTPAGVAVDATGRAVVAGSVTGAFPVTAGAPQTVLPAQPAGHVPVSAGFAAQMNASGTAFVCATYLGGTFASTATAVALDAQGAAYITGKTEAPDFPVTPGAYQTVFNNPNDFYSSGFVTKIDPSGLKLSYSTYFGEAGTVGLAIAVDPVGNAFITGSAGAQPPITPGVIFPTSPGGSPGFLTKMNAAGSSLIYSTFLPPSKPIGQSTAYGVSAAADGSVFVAQISTETTTSNIGGAQIVRISPDASSVISSQFIGDITLAGMAFDGSSRVAIVGSVAGVSPVTSGSYQEAPAGVGDAYVAVVDLATSTAPTLQVGAAGLNFIQGPFTYSPVDPITIDLTSSGAPIAFHISNSIPKNSAAGPQYSMSFSAVDGVTPASIVVNPNPGILGLTNPDHFSVVAAGASNGYQSIPVSLTGLGLQMVLNLVPQSPYEVRGPVYSFAFTDASQPAQTQTLHLEIVASGSRYRPPVEVAAPFSLTAYPSGAIPSWLTVQPASGTTPADITLTANPAGLPNGAQLAEIRLGNPFGIGPPYFFEVINVGNYLSVPTIPSFLATLGGPPLSHTVNLTSTAPSSPVKFTLAQSGPLPASWLKISPASGTTPAAVTFTVDPTGLAAGIYQTYVSFNGALGPVFMYVGPSVLGAGAYNAAAASPATTPAVAPGSLAAVYGVSLAASTAQASTLPLPLQLADATVTIGGLPAPLLYVSPNQINVQIPSALQPGSVPIQVTNSYGTATGTVTIVAAAPGVFVGGGPQPIIVNPDGSLNNPVHPAHPGDYLVVYMTGQGAVDHPVADGVPAPFDPLSRPLLPVTATIGGLNAPVAFAGLAPEFVGLLQLNVQVPDIYTGDQGLVVTIGTTPSDSFPVAVQHP